MSDLSDPLLEISGDEIRLRYWDESDLAVLVREMQDPTITRWIQHIPVPYGGANAREFLEQVTSQRQAGEAMHLAIQELDSNLVVGGIALTHIDQSEGTAEIGYWVGAGHRRQGLATRAVKLLAEWGFRQLGLQRLTLFTDPDNTWSQEVASKCGFQREGLLRGHAPTRAGGRRDSVIFGRLATDSIPV